MSTGEAVVEVRDLTKRYGSTVAVEDVSFDIEADEIFALVGPNGAGKTTTVEILECLRTPSSGTARVLGHDVSTDAGRIKADIGVVPQSFHTFERLSVRENVSLARGLFEDGHAVEEILAQLDLEEWAGKRFGDLSGGLQRRTGIAMALVSDPEVLFLDEPTTGLDPAARQNTWGQIERLTELGTTVVLTTHYMEEVEQLADRAALLVDGRLEAIDSVASLIEAYGGEVRVVVEADDENDAAAADVESILASGASSVHRSDGGDLVGLFDDRSAAQETFSRLHDLDGDRSIELTGAGMEDVFLSLVGRSLDSGGDLQ